MRAERISSGKLAKTAALFALLAIAIAVPLSPLRKPRPEPTYQPAASGYAGSESCRDCHQTEYNLWAGSHHALAERPINAKTDQRAFNPARSFRHGTQDTSVRLESGKFEIVTLGFKTNVEAYPLARVIGVDPVRQFLASAPGGRWQVHEASYDPHKNEWFDVYGNEDRRTGEWGHWTGRGMTWNTMCADCHNTALKKNFDASTDAYHTTLAEISVSCEACHGPMQSHVEWRKAHPNSTATDQSLKPMTPAQTLDTCASCHARRTDLTGTFKPGDTFSDHYSLEILDETERWHPDGQIKDEDYEWTSFISSKMYSSGVGCMDCHNPHSMKTLLPGNELCLRCHNGSVQKAPKIIPAEHVHHPLGSKGAECIGCHMPVTTYMQRHERHDHGFTIPDPLLTIESGIPNACNRCHNDKQPDWTLNLATQWYGGAMKRHTRERAEWIAAAQRGDDQAKGPLAAMLATTNQSPYWRAVAAALSWHWLDDPATQNALLSGLKDPNSLVRERSARSLEPLAHDPTVSAALQPLLNDPARNVRVAAAWTLRDSVDLNSRAGRDLQASLDFNADQPSGQFREAMLLLARRQPADAATHLRKAATFDPFSPPIHYTLGEVLGQSGQTPEALAELTLAEKLAPADPQMPYARAVILARTGNYTEARAAAARALELQRDFKPAQDLLGQLSGK